MTRDPESGRGDKVEHDDAEGQDPVELVARELLPEREVLTLCALAREARDLVAVDVGELNGGIGRGAFGVGADDACACGLALHLEAGSSVDDEPQEAVDDGHGHDAHDELADGAAARDLGSKHSDERRPRDPPAPVEDRPVVHPGLGGTEAVGGRVELREGIALEREDGEREDVPAPGLHVEVEEVEAGPEEEHAGEQEHPEGPGDLREATDPDVDARDDRDRRDGCDGPDDHDLGVNVLRDVLVEEAQARVELQDPEAEGGADTKEGRDDAEDVNGVSHPAIDAGADQRVEARLHAHGETLAVAEQPEEEPHERVDDPGVDAPVEERLVESQLGARVVLVGGEAVASSACAVPVRSSEAVAVAGLIVPDRLADAVVEETNSNARGEKHEEPRGRGELGLVVVLAELPFPRTC